MEVDNPAPVIAEEGLEFKKYSLYLDVVNIFLQYPKHYSWDYFALMKTQLDDSGQYRLPTLVTFLSVLSDSRVTYSSKNLPILLANFIRIGLHTMPVITAAADKILGELNPLEMGKLLALIDIAAELKDTKIVINYEKRGLHFNTAEQLLAYASL